MDGLDPSPTALEEAGTSVPRSSLGYDQSYDYIVQQADIEFKVGNIVEGTVLLIEAANADHPRAQFRVASLLKTGRGDLPVDHDQSVRWLNLLVQRHCKARDEDGVPILGPYMAYWVSRAYCQLGNAYLIGKGIIRSRSLAKHCYFIGASLKCFAAAYNYGLILCMDATDDTEQHDGLAWIKLAAANGNAKAKEYLVRYRK